MAKTPNTGFRGLTRGSTRGSDPSGGRFRQALTRGQATASALPQRKAGGTAGAGPGGDLKGGKAPRGKKLSAPANTEKSPFR